MKRHDYQKRGSAFWLANPRTYYAVDMGLGKTLITLDALVTIGKPALIVAPLTPVYTTWPNEIEKWDIPLSYIVVHGPDKDKAIRVKRDLYITNFASIPFVYNSLVQLNKERKPMPFEVCVIDEGSMIKAPKTKRLMYLEALRKIFPKYRAILSGTPAPNSIADLWAQYYFLCDGKVLGQSYGAFRRENFIADQYNPYSFTIKKGKDKEVYKKIKPYTFRLDEKDHLTLPSITYNFIPVLLPKRLDKMYKDFKKEFLLTLDSIDHIALNAASLSMKLRQFLQGFIYYDTGEFTVNDKPIRGATEIHTEKIKALKELIESVNQPVLCAIQFKHELDMLLKAFPSTPYIVGGVSNTEKIALIAKWNKGQVPLLLCHPGSISHGANLQSGGNIILWYCQTWSLEQYLQLNKRLHRQGQKHGVTVHHLVVERTIDIKIAKVLSQKNITQQALLDYLKDETNY